MWTLLYPKHALLFVAWFGVGLVHQDVPRGNIQSHQGQFLVGNVATKCRKEMCNQWIGNVAPTWGTPICPMIFFAQTTHMNFAQPSKQIEDYGDTTAQPRWPPNSRIKTEIQNWCGAKPGYKLDIRPRQILNHHATWWDINWEANKAALGGKQRNKMFGHRKGKIDRHSTNKTFVGVQNGQQSAQHLGPWHLPRKIGGL